MLAGTVLGSGMACLDATVVNVALPHHRRGPRHRLRRAAVDRQRLHAHARRADPARRLARRPLRPPAGVPIGVVWFALASLLCGVAPNVGGARRGPDAAGRRRGAAHAGQPGDDPGVVPTRRTGRGDRGVVGAAADARRSARSSAVTGGRRLVALDLPDQPAARRRWCCGSRCAPRARVARRPSDAGPSTCPGASSVRSASRWDDVGADRPLGVVGIAARSARGLVALRRRRAASAGTRCCRSGCSARGSSAPPT